MPVVPRYEGQVSLEPLGKQQVSTDAPLEAFGGGQALERSGAAIRDLAATGERISFEEMRRQEALQRLRWRESRKARGNVDSLLADQAYGRIRRKQIELEENKLKPRIRAGLIDEVEDLDKEFEEAISKEVEGMPDEDRRTMLLKKVEASRTDWFKSLNSYRANRIDKMQDESYAEIKKNSINNAVVGYTDPVRVDRSIKELEQTAYKYALDTGKPREWLLNEVGEGKKAAYSNIFQTMARDNIPLDKMEAFYKRHQTDFGDQTDAMLGILEKKRAVVRVENQAESIWKDSVYDIESARNMINEKVAPEDRKEVRQLVEMYRNNQKNSEELAYDELWLQAVQAVKNAPDRTMPVSKILSPDVLANIKPADLQTLDKLNDTTRHNPEKWNEFYGKFHDGSMKRMKQGEFERYYANFDEDYRNKARKYYDIAQKEKKDKNKEYEYKKIISDDQMILNGMRMYDIVASDDSLSKLKGDKAERFNYIKQAWDDRIEIENRDGSKKITDADKKRILNEIIRDTVTVEKKSWFGLRSTPQEVPLSGVTKKEKGQYSIPINQLPDTAVSNIIRVGRQNGVFPENMSDKAIRTKFKSVIERYAGHAKVNKDASDEEMLNILRGK